MSDAHPFADKEEAAERYVLGQMTESDCEAYEQHFFQCPECAQEVKATVQFIDSCQRVLSDPAFTGRLPSHDAQRRWFPSTTAVVLTGALAASVGIIVYQNVMTIPRLMAPRALTPVSLIASNARGTTAQPIVVPRGQPFLLFVDIPPGRFDAYDGAIVAKEGRVIPVAIPAALTQDTVPLVIPPGLLSPGDYTLVVTGRSRGGGASAEVARFGFTLRFADDERPGGSR